MRSSEIRQSFIDFFVERGHSRQLSSPVIPLDDPTLLFVNAGMNQFKDVFTGARRVSYSRAVTAQKCLRAGGKHNDLDNVGQTGRHHTFFEMLGNFSFGDYFKEEAIAFAWEWVTAVLGLSSQRLYATVYEEDDEAFALWEKIAPELKNGRILRFGKKDNYWSMGEVGPCGPCSEIHYDMGAHLSKNQPDAWINSENERYVEIWNLVFMQYDQLSDGRVINLPKPSVDTGAGLERLAAVLQGVDSNYETDLFRPLTGIVADLTGDAYDAGPKGISHRVLADHVRALSFALSDGGGMSNEGRGYVLRRILRRAARHGRLLGYKEPIVCRLVSPLVDLMGGPYGELKEKQNHIEAVIKSEEERFSDLLDTGLELFSQLEKKVKASGSDTISGDDIFKLYDTYGFPVDMTAIMAGEAGLKMDMAGCDECLRQRQEQSRAGSSFKANDTMGFPPVIKKLKEDGIPIEPTQFVRGDEVPAFEIKATIRSISKSLDNPNKIALILDRTPFYIESGGQVGDIGMIVGQGFVMLVTGVIKHQDFYIHIGKLQEGDVQNLKDTKVVVRIDKNRRRDIMRNHTATHLLHAALRKTLGDHVKQSGSLVEADKLRFDFAHFQAMLPEEIALVERLVNDKILEAEPVTTREMSVGEAMNSGAMALFGEKYGDTVRVVSVDGFSKELCGGTHVTNTAEIGFFFITSESAIASGVRRIEAITGRKAKDMALRHKRTLLDIGARLNVGESEIPDAFARMAETVSELQKENKKLKAERFSGGGKAVGQSMTIGSLKFVYHDFGPADEESVSGWIDAQKGSHDAVVALAAGIIDGKRTFIVAVSGKAVAAGFDAGKHFGEVVRGLGGRGGGKAAFARGGLPEGLSFDDLVRKAAEKIQEVI